MSFYLNGLNISDPAFNLGDIVTFKDESTEYIVVGVKLLNGSQRTFDSVIDTRHVYWSYGVKALKAPYYSYVFWSNAECLVAKNKVANTIGNLPQ